MKSPVFLLISPYRKQTFVKNQCSFLFLFSRVFQSVGLVNQLKIYMAPGRVFLTFAITKAVKNEIWSRLKIFTEISSLSTVYSEVLLPWRRSSLIVGILETDDYLQEVFGCVDWTDLAEICAMSSGVLNITNLQNSF